MSDEVMALYFKWWRS